MLTENSAYHALATSCRSHHPSKTNFLLAERFSRKGGSVRQSSLEQIPMPSRMDHHARGSIRCRRESRKAPPCLRVFVVPDHRASLVSASGSIERERVGRPRNGGFHRR